MSKVISSHFFRKNSTRNVFFFFSFLIFALAFIRNERDLSFFFFLLDSFCPPPPLPPLRLRLPLPPLPLEIEIQKNLPCLFISAVDFSSYLIFCLYFFASSS